MKKILLTILVLVIIFIAYLFYNVYNFKSTQLQVEPLELVSVPDGAVDRFVEAISIRTVSFEEETDFDSIQFKKFNRFLEDNYPLIHRELGHTIFSEFSHLYHWKGSDSSLKPIILMAHYDVVPIATPSAWSEHPFVAGVVNDTIYGRGAMDFKFGVIGIMESVEQLLKESYKPQRDIYISLGHDEEVLGPKGAFKIAQYLKNKRVEAHFVLDEGMAITEGLVLGLNAPVALIGIAEKGILSLELTTAMAGGHSSAPAKETSIDVLARAVSKVKENPCPRSFNPVLDAFMDKIGPEMDFRAKFVFANRNIFKSVLLDEYEKKSTGNATIRTTTSPTIFEAGIKENVIPTAARAVINFRIIPGETKEDVIAHLKNVIDDERVTIEMSNEGANPSSISPVDNVQYERIERSIKQIFPNIKTAPYLVIGGTDSRHFNILTKNIYRFSPFILNSENLTCFHGIDERIPKSEFENGIRFYRQIILNNSKG